jgi:PAS domain S-box-containing protein
MEDITERKQALDALIQANAELDRRVVERTAELAGANRLLEAEIAERKQAEEAMSRSEARFRAVVEHSNDGIILCDDKANVLYRSPSYAAINGFTDDERIGKNAFDMIHPEEIDGVKKNWKRMLENPGNVYKMESRICHADGTWRWVDSTAKNMLADPNVQAIFIVSRDITDRKRNELALIDLNERLEMALNAAGAGSWDWDIP